MYGLHPVTRRRFMSQVARTEKGYLCKRDGSLMYLVYESEKTTDNKLKVVISYKCPVCGFKVERESIELSRLKDSFTIVRVVRKIPV